MQIWKSTKGAIDLASIMVGIIIIGIIGGVIAATVFAVIPWSQDNAAKASLDSVKQAQNVYAGLSADPDNKTMPSPGSVSFAGSVETLAQKKLLSAGKAESLRISAGQNLECYVAAIKSDSGKVFWMSDKLPTKEYKTGDESRANCGNLAGIVEGMIDSPATPPLALTTSSCSLGNQTSFCFDVSGKLYASGKNQNNQINATSPAASTAFTEVAVPQGVTFTKVRTNSDTGNTSVVTTYALDTTGRIWSWGGTAKTTPAVLSESQKFVDFNVSTVNVVALDDKGAVWINGSNSWNQFALNSPTFAENTQKFVRVENAPANIVKANVANQAVIVLDSSGKVWVWGNPSKNHPNPTGGRTIQPTVIDIPVKIANIATGSAHILALDENNKIWSWGSNNNGQLGNGSSGSATSSTTPTIIASGLTFKAIESQSNSQSSYAIASDGTLYSWGYNYYGQLGNGNTTNVLTPTPIVTDKKFVSVESTFYAGSATTDNKEILVWGRNDVGQLGIGTSTHALTPVVASLK